MALITFNFCGMDVRIHVYLYYIYIYTYVTIDDTYLNTPLCPYVYIYILYICIYIYIYMYMQWNLCMEPGVRPLCGPMILDVDGSACIPPHEQKLEDFDSRNFGPLQNHMTLNSSGLYYPVGPNTEIRGT